MRRDLKTAPVDDWEPPKKSSYSMPRRYSANPKNTSAATPTENSVPAAQTADSSASEVSKEKRVSTTSDSASAMKLTAGNGTASNSAATPAVNASVNQLAATGEDDLDLESAIAVLPPELQDVLRKQIAAAKQKSLDQSISTSTIVSTPVPESVQTTNTLSEAGPTVVQAVAPVVIGSPSSAIDQQSAVVPASAIVPLSTETASTDSAKATEQSSSEGKVRVSISDMNATSVSEPPESTPAVDEVAASVSDVVPASATQPVIEPKQNIESIVQQATVLPDATPLTWQQQLAQACVGLEAVLADSDSLEPRLRLQYELALRAVYLANNRLDDALKPIEGLSANEQEYFRHQLQALFESTNPEGIPVASRRWALVMESQRKATSHLAAVSTLEVRNVSFCTEVQGYGITTPFKTYQFKPDQDVLLYCELENVTAEELKSGFETQLQGNYEIIDRNGKRIADQLLPMEKEVCANHRRDYFVVYRIFMPLQIPAGSYELRLTIEDMKGKKFGQTKVDFQIQKDS